MDMVSDNLFPSVFKYTALNDAERELNIVGIHSQSSKKGIATIEVSFHTKGRQQILSLVECLRQIENVLEIQRTTG